jgi:hypothetical protein
MIKQNIGIWRAGQLLGFVYFKSCVTKNGERLNESTDSSRIKIAAKL